MFRSDDNVPAGIRRFAEKLLADVEILTPDMRKGSVNYDHYQIKSLVEVAYLHSILTEILTELRYANREQRRKDFPGAIF